MSKKTVWMVSGNKGGVGKSLFCLALASALEHRDLMYAVFDGDERTGDVYQAFRRKCPARLGDFRRLRPDSHMCDQDQIYEEALYRLLQTSDHLIVNTPDGADAVIKKWFDVTLRHTEGGGWDFRLVYLMSDRPDGLDILPDLAQSFSFLYPVRNLHFGPDSIFTAFNQEYRPGFQVVLDLPALRTEEVRMLFDLKTYPAEALRLRDRDTSTFAIPTLARARLRRWQDDVSDMVWGMLDNTDMPNLVHDKW